MVKPIAGLDDLVGRTMDKAYTGITGQKAPSWLVNNNNNVISKLATSYDKAYQERDKPTNTVSEITEGAVGTLPLIASMFTGGGEANLATKAPQVVSKLTKMLAVTGAANAYKDATDNKQDYGSSLKEAAVGGAKGALNGATMEAQMLLGGAMGKGVVGQLVKKGLFKGGKATEAVLHALSVGTVFGGTPAVEDVFQGKDIDTHEALKQFGTGLMFEAIPVAKGLNDEIATRKDNAKINDQAAQTATLSTAASNLHGESVLRTLMTTPKDQLLQINESIPDGHEDLYANSIEQGAKAFETKDNSEKRNYLTNQLLLKTQGDVKYISDKVKADPTEILTTINDSAELSPEQKGDLIDKVQSLSAQEQQLRSETKPESIDEQTTPNQEVPIEPQANETGQTGETPKTVDEASGDNNSKWLDEKDINHKIAKPLLGETQNFTVRDGKNGLEFWFKDEGERFKNNVLPVNVQVDKSDNNRIHIDGLSDELKGKGYGKEIYKSLIEKYGIISTSEFSSSKEAKRIWDSLIKSGEYHSGEVTDGEGTSFKAVANSKEAIDKFIKDKQNKFENIVNRSEPNGDNKVETPISDNYPYPKKPVEDMTSDEMREHAKEIKKYQKGLDVEFFGEDGAKEYQSAVAVENSMFATDEKRKEAYAITKKYHDSLTPEQSKVFFGEAGNDHQFDPDELRDTAQKVHFIEEGENVDDLASSIKTPLMDYRADNKNNDAKILLKSAARRAAELGIDPMDMLKNGIKKVIDDLPGKDGEDLDHDKELLTKSILAEIQKTSTSIPPEQNRLSETQKQIGENKDAPITSPNDINRKSIESETNPDNIASRYHEEQGGADTKEKAIIDYLGNSKINERDYNRWGDSNRLGDHTDPKRLRWIDSKNSDKTDLATHAEIISHEIGQQVTPEDIIDVVDKYKGKADFIDKNKTDTQKMLEEKYLDLTGKKLTPSAAEKAYNEKLREQAKVFLDNAKELNHDERQEADDLLKPEGITIKDIENYESELQQQPAGGEQPAATETNAEVVQQSKDEPATDAGKDTGGEKPQGEPDGVSEKESAIRKEIADAEKEFNDFIKNSRKTANTFANVGEFIGKATKLITAYTKLGLYKFGEVIDQMRKSFGDDFVDENMNEIKGAYAYTRAGVDKSERGKFDNEDAVDAYIETKSTTNTPEPKKAAVEPINARDDMAELKVAGNKKKSLEKAVEKEAPKDELLKEFSSLDPRYFTPDEVQKYNELTNEKSPSQLQRDEIAKFIDDFHDRQETDAEKRQADWYKQIQEDDDLSTKEAKEVLKESAETTDAQPDLENTEKDKKAKNAFSKIITQYKKELRGADVPTDMADVKKALLEVDETKLSTRQARDIAKTMDAILYDGNYAGAGKAIALSKAVENAKAIATDFEKRGFDKGDLSQFWADFRTLDQNVEMISKSSKGASVIQNKAGIHEISAGNAKVNKMMNDVSKAYEKLTNGMGKDILNVENRYKRGILASIMQVADKDLPSDSFIRYKNYIKETGEILSKSKIPVEQKEGKLVTELYNKFMDGKEDAPAVIEAITKDNPNNTKIVNFFIKQFEGTYGDLRRNTLLYQGKDLPFIQQYTPTQMKRLRGYDELETPDVSITDPISFNGTDEPTDTKGSRTTISRRDLKTLKGTKRVMNLDFDGLALNKYRESNYDIQTMEARHLFDNIRKIGDFKTALGGSRNVNVIANGVSNMVQRQKGFNRTSPEARAAIQLLNVVSGKGVRIALQGTAQFLKQYPSVGLNTLANLGPDMGLYFKSIARLGLHDPIFDKSGIGLRASQHGGTSFELDLRKVKNTDFSGPVIKSLAKLTSFGDKMNKVFSYALTTADDAVARNSWGAYYMKDLKRQGVDLDNVDWTNEHKNINEEAAAYAEQMVSRNQIQNDPSKQANFLYGGGVESGKDVGSVILKGLAFPFSSFARNAQARLESDLRKFSGGDRKEATVSIISGIAEAAAFNALKIAVIGPAINAVAAAILPKFGFSKPADKDLEDRAKQIPAQALNDVLLSGFGALTDNMILKGLNRAANPNNDKKVAQWLVPNYDPAQYGETDFGMAGIYGVLPGKLYQLQQEANYIDGKPTGEAYDSHKKEMVKYQSQLTERQQHMAEMVFAIDVLGVLGVSDAEVLRLNQKLYREMAKEKAPIKYHSGYNKNSKAKPKVVK